MTDENQSRRVRGVDGAIALRELVAERGGFVLVHADPHAERQISQVRRALLGLRSVHLRLISGIDGHVHNLALGVLDEPPSEIQVLQQANPHARMQRQHSVYATRDAGVSLVHQLRGHVHGQRG